MNELVLSNNLKQIELEINHHKQIAGQSIWEIGRRLSHVKENDLAHGEFISWVESIGFSRQEAHRFMKVSERLPNDSTFSHLGESALYLIATLPEEERKKEHMTSSGEVKTADEMTVRELRELKKQIKQKETQIALKEKRIQSLTQRNEDLEFKANQKQQIIEKEVVKEVKVTPHDYEGLKSDIAQLSEALKKSQAELKYAQAEADAATKRNGFIEGQHKDMLKQREEVNSQALEYQELKESIARMQGKMDKQQKDLTAMKRITRLVKESNEYLYKISPIKYWEEFDRLKGNQNVKEEIIELVERTEHWCEEMRKVTNTNIVEGEIING